MRALLLVILTVSVTGCGTMANLEGKRYAFISAPGQKPVRLYGGVRNDFDWVSEGFGIPESERHTANNSDIRRAASIIEDPVGVAVGVPVLGYFAVVDPVLSFVGDTITLPHVIRVMRDAAGDSNVNLAHDPRVEREP